jgi:hypothetical protein
MKIALFLVLVLAGQQAAAQQTSILLRQALVFDGTGNEPVRDMDILIRNDTIEKTGKNLKAPRGARIIDCKGKTVIPGLIDMHGHLYAFGSSQFDAYPKLYLAGGVTTIFTPGEFEPVFTDRLKNAIRNGLVIGPEVLSAGPYFTSRPSPVGWIWPYGTADSLEMFFNKWKGAIDGIKVYSSITEEHFDRMIKLARENNLVVTGHLGKITTRYAVEHGINGLEHGITTISDFGAGAGNYQSTVCNAGNLDLDQPGVDSLIDLIVSKKVYMDPTMVLLDNMQSDFKPVVNNLDYYLDSAARVYMRAMKQGIRSYVPDSCAKKALKKQLVFTRKFFDKGGLLVAGTDPVNAEILPGFGIKREIMLFVQSGIPLSKAIRIASLNAAIALRMANKTGSIEAGKRADLSIIDGDITADINLLTATEWVIRHGTIYKSSELLESVKGKIKTGIWKIRTSF